MVARRRGVAPLGDKKNANGLYVHSSPPRVLNATSAHIRQLIRSGDVDRLEQLVLDGQGAKLVGEYAADYKTRVFLRNTVPQLMSKIHLLHDAVSAGSLDELQALLQEDCAKRKKLALCKDPAGVGLLHKAVYYDLKDIYRWLIENFPQTATLKDADGRTAAHYMAMCKEPRDLQRMLAAAGADIYATDAHGHNYKYYMDNPGELELPSVHKQVNGAGAGKSTVKDESPPDVSKGTIPNYDICTFTHGGQTLKGFKYYYQYTPDDKSGLIIKPSNIRIWIHQRDLGRLQKVLWEGHGAKLRRETSNSPRVKRFLEAVPYLMGYIKDIHTAAVNNDLELITDRTNDPVPPVILSSKDSHGLTALHKAAGLGHMDIVKFILEKLPTAVSLTDGEGRTALHYAVLLKDDDEMYNTLISSGAEEGALDNRSKTAAYYRTRPNELDAKLLSKVPDAPRTAGNGFPPNWDWNLLNPPDENSRASKKSDTVFGTTPTEEKKAEEELSNDKTPDDPEPDPEPDPEEPETENEPESQVEEPASEMTEENGDAPKENGHKEANGHAEENHHEENDHEETPEEPEPEAEPEHPEEHTEEHPAEEEHPEHHSDDLDYESNEIIHDHNHDHDDHDDHHDHHEHDHEDLQEAKSDTPESQKIGVIEGVVNGEDEVETLNNDENNEKGGGDGEVDTEVLEMVESGNMEQLAALVLNGEGDRLIGQQSDNPEIQAFLENVPIYMSKINRVHVSSRDGSLRDLQAALDRRKFAIAKDPISPNGASPLHVATVFGNTSIVRYLAGRFPETLHMQDDNGRTPLHYAATVNDNGHYYNLLLHLGANSNIEDKLGHTPDYYKDDQEEFSHRKLLAEFGAEEDQADDMLQDKENSNSNPQVDIPLFRTEEGRYLASSLGDPLIKGLTEVANKRPEDPIAYLATYLFNFSNSDRGRLRTQERIQNQIIKPETPQNSQPGTIDVVTIDPDDQNDDDTDTAYSASSRDEHGQSMLHFAAARSHGRNALFQLLQETDINIGYRDELYRTARDVSIQANVPENTQEIDRYVISIAARGDTDKLVELLLEGYDHIIDVVDEDDTPITEIVANREQTETVSFLHSILAFEERRERVHHAIRQGNLENVREMLADEQETGSGKLLAIGKNSYGRCTLHIAVLCQQEEIVDFLANTFADTLLIGDNLERTALHYAMGVERVESISRVLIEAGAKRVMKDLKGRQASYYFMNKSDILRLQEEEETF